MLDFFFHPDASLELEEAADWYERQRDGLGREFVAAVRAKVALIVEGPERYPEAQRARRALVGRFPYAVVYRVTAVNVEIVAVAHVKRRPRYWSRR